MQNDVASLKTATKSSLCSWTERAPSACRDCSRLRLQCQSWLVCAMAMKSC